jgi:hypothetical protein
MKEMQLQKQDGKKSLPLWQKTKQIWKKLWKKCNSWSGDGDLYMYLAEALDSTTVTTKSYFPSYYGGTPSSASGIPPVIGRTLVRQGNGESLR